MATATAEKTQKKKKKNPVWVWKAKAKGGEVRSGEMEAIDKAAVEARLRQMGMTPEKVKKKPIEIAFKIPGATGVTRKDLIIFTRQFSTMIDAGLPLVQCLDILSSQLPNPNFKVILKAVKAKVEGGATLADALSDHPKVFDELYSQLVRAGEVGGILDTILNRLATYIEKADRLIRQVKGAMIYPAMTTMVGLVVVVVLLVFVVPVFESMFKDFGSALPAPTQIVVNLSHFAQDYFVIFLIGVAASIVGFKVFTSHPKGKFIWHQVLLKAPLFGDLLRKVAVARFTRTLGTMISSGVSILDALEVCAKSSGNLVIMKGIMRVREEISAGKTMAEPLAEVGVFPPMVVQMIGVGEATGAMDTMLAKIADFYDEEVEQAVTALTSMIEPFMMVFLGTVVGGFMIAMYMPIFSMADAVG